MGAWMDEADGAGVQGLTADGKVGTATWSRLITVFNQQLG